LHEKLGFEKIGILERVGWKLDRWVDASYWGSL
jgi:L-amino acid N-acyltransferase YncA